MFVLCVRIFFVFSAGRYVLMASLYDRLGGHVMKWSNLKGQQWGGATLPLFHEGEFYNIEVKVSLIACFWCSALIFHLCDRGLPPAIHNCQFITLPNTADFLQFPPVVTLDQ